MAVKQEKEGKTLERRELMISIGKNAGAILVLVMFLLMTQSFFRAKPAGDEEPIAAAESPRHDPSDPTHPRLFSSNSHSKRYPT